LVPVLALHLVPLSGEPLISHLRIVDKYAMNPPTIFVIREFQNLLQEQKDLVDYRQADLTVPGTHSNEGPYPALIVSHVATVTKSFTDPAPNTQPYTHIIDLTGETSFDSPPEVFISQTLNVSLLIAREAARRSVKSYVRCSPSFYNHLEEKVYKETDVDGWKPFGDRGIWSHETARAVGSIPNLPLVVMRSAMPYGPGYVHQGINTPILLGLVYKHLNQELKFGWCPNLRKNTIHTSDWAGGIWATSIWAGEHDRAGLNAAAGVSLTPTGDILVETTEETIKTASGGVLVPVINLVGADDVTMERTGAVIAKVCGSSQHRWGWLLMLPYSRYSTSM
jgi:hypothetical protein